MLNLLLYTRRHLWLCPSFFLDSCASMAWILLCFLHLTVWASCSFPPSFLCTMYHSHSHLASHLLQVCLGACTFWWLLPSFCVCLGGWTSLLFSGPTAFPHIPMPYLYVCSCTVPTHTWFHTSACLPLWWVPGTCASSLTSPSFFLHLSLSKTLSATAHFPLTGLPPLWDCLFTCITWPHCTLCLSCEPLWEEETLGGLPWDSAQQHNARLCCLPTLPPLPDGRAATLWDYGRHTTTF